MKPAKLVIGLLMVPFLLVGCSRQGDKNYKAASVDLKARTIQLLADKSAASASSYAPKEYTLLKFGINYSDGYVAKNVELEGWSANEKWVCVIHYTYTFRNLDINSEESKTETVTNFVFYSNPTGEINYDDVSVFNYNLIKDQKGAKHVVYEAQKY